MLIIKESEMQVNSNSYLNANENAHINATMYKNEEELVKGTDNSIKELSVEEQIKKSSVEVSISMNAQIVLFALDSGDKIKNNTLAQKDILNFLSGDNISDDFNLKNIGYEGKPITKLSQNEAQELISEGGFFGVDQTSQRVAGFVFSFAGENIELLEKGLAGIVQGFKEAEDMWGGELPEISYETQAKTISLIEERIAQLKGKS